MKELLLDVAVLKANAASDDPWARAQRPAASADRRDVRGVMGTHADDGSHAETSRGIPRRHALPLTLPGSLGSVGYKDKPMFEDKLATSEFQYDGVKGGTAWKTTVECYMVYKAPVLKELLEWAEAKTART